HAAIPTVSETVTVGISETTSLATCTVARPEERFMTLDRFTTAYIEAALWSSMDENTPDGGEPLDANHRFADLAPETLDRIKADCAAFQEQKGDDISDDVERAGHDF